MLYKALLFTLLGLSVTSYAAPLGSEGLDQRSETLARAAAVGERGENWERTDPAIGVHAPIVAEADED
ncbi:hypothetical protein ANO14919_098890 [Xylariales sp. No.14919]|nr:hypothetical protein ANO14919_098890 [Xylariales sp. No.14919]